MAVTYGAYSQRARIGIDVSMSPSTVTKDTSSVTLTWTYYIQTTYAYSHNGTFVRSGTGPTGSTSYSLSTPNGVTTTRTVGSWTQTVSTSYSGTVSRSSTATFPGSGTMFDGAKPTHTRSFTVPQRPPQVPSAPTSASVSRHSDTRQNVSWVRPSNASTAGTIWTNAVVQRSVNGGSYGTVATLSGTATSWSDTATSANSTYRYRVAGRNASGTSAYAYTSYIDTTPAAPTNVVAIKDGSDIIITWTDNSPYNTGWEVYDNGVLIATRPAWPSSYIDPSPNPSVTHQYTVRAFTDRPGVLYSAFGTSNTVQLQAPPNAPTNLTPNGVPYDAGQDLFLQWDHNPVDTTAQTAVEIQHRLVGGSTWTTISGGVWDWYHFSPATSFYPSGSSVEWRVRTKGAHPNWSPYSAVATFSIVTPPVASLIYPDSGGTHDLPSIEVEWSYYQADGHPQSGWQVQILQGTQVIASGSGTGSVTRTWTSPTVLQGEQSYDVRVRVRESSGFWSAWETQTILVQFDPPPEPTASVKWMDAGYYEVTGEAQSEGGAPEPVTLNLERSVNGGPWQILEEDLGLEFTYFDWTAPMVGHVAYRITAVSALPSTASTVVVIDRSPEEECEILLSGGPGYTMVARFLYEQRRNVTAGRERVLNQFDGRPNGVSSSGAATPLSFDVSAVLAPVPDCGDGSRPVTTVQGLIALAEQPGTHLYRDHDGFHFPCHLSDVQVSPDFMGEVSFTVTRVDFPTQAELLALRPYQDVTMWGLPEVPDE